VESKRGVEVSTGCRIGWITDKNTGAKVRLIPKERFTSRIGDDLVRNAGEMKDFPEAWAGYMIVGWDFEGKWTCSYNNHRNSPYARHMMPGMLADAMRDRITEATANDVADERFDL
jgi:hypothetical protein